MRSKVYTSVLAALLVFSMIAVTACDNMSQPPASSTASSTASTSSSSLSDSPKITSLPRNETLYFSGNIGKPNNFNPISGNASFPVVLRNELIYQSLFGWDMLTATQKPITAKSYEFTDDYTITVKMFPEAKWNDGKPLTAEDVAYTFNFAKEYSVIWSSNWDYLDAVEATNNETVAFKLKKSPYNPLIILNALARVSILPKHVLEQWIKESNGNIDEMRKIFNENPVGSGPYKLYFSDETKIVLIRDDDWWGVANNELSGGQLPAPKYCCYPIYVDNDESARAFQTGEADVTQNFIPQVWKMWEGGAPIRCYLPELPYYVSASMPSIIFNMKIPGLDNVDVRRAIAYSIDYDKIAELAMSGYSQNLKPSLMLLNGAEAKYTDAAANDSLRWEFNVDKANEILDAIGAKPGADGIRVLPDGTRLGPWKLMCPAGWSDWQASLEVIANGSSKIGIELVTDYPEAPVVTNMNQMGDFDITMQTYEQGTSPAQPWIRARSTFSSTGVPDYGQQAFYNFGRFKNDRVNELIEAIPAEKDEAKLKAMYTELDKLWLENIPSIPLMYRPSVFYTFNETHWTGFPVEGDGTGVGPEQCMLDWGIKGLFNLKPVK